MSNRARNLGIVATAGAAILWGTSFPVTKYALDYFGDPLFFAAVRVAIAAILSLLILILLKKVSWNLYKSPVIWLIGAANAFGIALQNYGMDLTSASKTVLLVDINVVIVALLSYWLFREVFGLKKVAGVVSGIIGVVLLTYSPDIALQYDQLLGDIMVFMSGVMYAIFIVAMKKTLSKVDPFEASVAAIVTSAILLMLPCMFMIPAGMMDSAIEFDGLLPMLYLAIACTTIAYFLWAFGLKRISATASSTILLLEVLSGLLLSILALGETLTGFIVAGGIFIIIAIVLVSEIGMRKDSAEKKSSS